MFSSLLQTINKVLYTHSISILTKLQNKNTQNICSLQSQHLINLSFLYHALDIIMLYTHVLIISMFQFEEANYILVFNKKVCWLTWYISIRVNVFSSYISILYSPHPQILPCTRLLKLILKYLTTIHLFNKILTIQATILTTLLFRLLLECNCLYLFG